MNLSPIVLAIALMGMTGTLQAKQPSQRAPRVRQSEASKATYQVRRGDTVSKIVRTCRIDRETLEQLNPKVNLNRLVPGMVLRVAPAQKMATRVVSQPESEHMGIESAPPLPTTPRIAPESLVHLERVLPAPIRPAAAENTPAATVGLSMDNLRPLLPKELTADAGTLPDLPFTLVDPNNLDLLWPVETRTVSSKWGPRTRTRVVTKKKGSKKYKVQVRFSGKHKGVDLNAPQGTDIYAVLDGQVINTGFHRQYGYFVEVDHGNGVTTLYAHNSANFVQEGDIIRRGQKIAAIGRTGRATGPHLHFELRLDGVHRDPLPYLNQDEEITPEMLAFNQSVSTRADSLRP